MVLYYFRSMPTASTNDEVRACQGVKVRAHYPNKKKYAVLEHLRIHMR